MQCVILSQSKTCLWIQGVQAALLVCGAPGSLSEQHSPSHNAPFFTPGLCGTLPKGGLGIPCSGAGSFLCLSPYVPKQDSLKCLCEAGGR